MGKAAATKKTTTPATDELDKDLAMINARGMFMAATMNMGWRLAITVVIPIVGGVKLDEHFHTSPSYTLLGMFIAVAAGCSAVWTTIKEINRQQAADDAKQPKGRNKRAE